MPKADPLKRSIAVTIAGQRYLLRSDEDDQYVRQLASLVDQRFRAVQSSTKQVSTHAIAMLTALQMADDLLKERGKRAELRARVRESSRQMLKLISRNARK